VQDNRVNYEKAPEILRCIGSGFLNPEEQENTTPSKSKTTSERSKLQFQTPSQTTCSLQFSSSQK